MDSPSSPERLIVAGTGHRPDKLGGYDQNAMEWVDSIALRSLRLINPSEVISGFALGWDMALAKAALALNIPLTAAIPFRGQERLWPESSKRIYADVLKRAHHIVYVCEDGYAPWKMQVRNRWMVDRCNLLVALWDGSSGGTRNCIHYADKVQREVLNAYPMYMKQSDLLLPLEYSRYQ